MAWRPRGGRAIPHFALLRQKSSCYVRGGGRRDEAIVRLRALREHAGLDADALIMDMRTHLAGCPACAEEYASLAALLRS
jgi:hypothetical protein